MDSEWNCLCPTGFDGSLCENAACLQNPCVGGSTCIPKQNAEVICMCPVGRHGPFCESSELSPKI